MKHTGSGTQRKPNNSFQAGHIKSLSANGQKFTILSFEQYKPVWAEV